MRSPITKLAAAAVVAVACVIGALLWQGTGSGVTLADVLEELEQVTAYRYQIRLTGTEAGEQSTEESELPRTVLVSREHGIKAYTRIDPNSSDSRGWDTYLLPRQKTIIFVDHNEKSYVPLKYEEREIDYYKQEYSDPHTIIRQILACDHVSLGQSVIDGVTVEGFQTTDLGYKGGFFGQDDYFVGGYAKVDVKLWVDVETFLPLRLEEDIVNTAGKHMHHLCYDFRWNVVVSEADFEPDIPDDYTSPIGDVIIPASNEDTMIRGLESIGELLGHYPTSLDMAAIGSHKNQLLERIGYSGPDSLTGLSNEERTERFGDITLLVMPWFCYEELVEGEKDPAYYGQTVQPGEADKVLLRWKLEDGQYRVVFGDLSARTVTAEELAELEQP